SRANNWAELLGLPALEGGAALRRLGCGYMVGYRGEAWATFPMRDGSGRVVGIRRRRVSDGMKLTIKGGHEGLFVAMPLADDQILYVVEGASDTAAAIAALGHSSVIGRPSCNSGNQHLMQWVRLHKDKAIVVVPDEG